MATGGLLSGSGVKKDVLAVIQTDSWREGGGTARHQWKKLKNLWAAQKRSMIETRSKDASRCPVPRGEKKKKTMVWGTSKKNWSCVLQGAC